MDYASADEGTAVQCVACGHCMRKSISDFLSASFLFCSLWILSALFLCVFVQLDKLSPDALVYDSLIGACAAVSDLNLGMHAFKAMRQARHIPQHASVVVLLRMCKDLGRLEAAREGAWWFMSLVWMWS